MLEKVLLVGALVILVVAGCTGRAMARFSAEFGDEFDAEFVDALNIPDEVTVTKRVNGDTVFSERVATNGFDNDSAEFANHDEVDIDDLTSVNFNFDHSGLRFEVAGTNEAGEAVDISADLTKGNNSTIDINVSN